MNNFPRVFRELRLEKGLTKVALAKELGFNHVTLVNWENGKRMPDVETIIQIANYFKVTVDQMLGLDQHIT